MNLFKKIKIITVGFLLAYVSSASAHIGYTGRNFGVFAGDGSDPSKLIASNTVSGDFGWASGTDANLGDSHKTRAFRFSLLATGLVTLEIQGLDIIRSGVPVSALANPGFSIYKGLAHISPAAGDHDDSVISTLYNDTTYGVGNWEGSFNALGDWKIGNDDGLTFADLSTFTYIGNAADGSYVNYGNAAGILGDGVADGYVKASFVLGPGDYSIFVGGADIGGSSTSNFAFNATLSVVPEPSTYALLTLGTLLTIVVLRRQIARGRNFPESES
jgi:hypothetical protein